jgi:predicted phosphate transport protein (TIGR00153 family)
MKLDKIFQILVPKDKKFYPLFKEASTNLVAAAVLLTEMVRNGNNTERAEYVSKIKALEHIGDDYTKTLLMELNRTFITPFDREDILELANRLDGVVDLINTTAKRIVLYNLTEIPKEFIEMADLILACAKEIDSIFNGLKDVHSLLQYKDSCRLINHQYLAKIFQEETNGIELIKKKDILTSLEKAIDRCEDVADVIQTLIIKNA